MSWRVVPADSGGFWLYTPYDADFIDMLKNMLKKRLRKWNHERRAWWISPLGIDDAKQLADCFWTEARVAGKERRPPPRQPGTIADHYAALHLLPSAPAELVKVAYRTLSKMYHPDHGGDEKKQVALNVAYEKLRQA